MHMKSFRQINEPLLNGSLKEEAKDIYKSKLFMVLWHYSMTNVQDIPI